MRLTENQAALLALAAVDGQVTSRDALTAHLGPATGGLLVNLGLLRDLGRQGKAQNYEITDAGRAWLAREEER